MKLRRHHNNKDHRHIKRVKCVSDIKKIAKKLKISYKNL